MTAISQKTSLSGIEEQLPSLPAKMEELGRFIISNPSRAAFLNIKQLAGAAGVSEATVTRFVTHFGYDGYADFLRSLRGLVSERLPAEDLPVLPSGPWGDRIQRELRQSAELFARLPLDPVIAELSRLLPAAAGIYILASPPAARLFWELSRLRAGVTLGGESTLRDEENMAALPEGSLVLAFIKSYSTVEMGRLLRLARELRLPLFIISDSSSGTMGEYTGRYLALAAGELDLPFNLLISHLIDQIAPACALRYRDHQQRLERLTLDHQPVTERPDTLQLAVSHDIRSLDPSGMHGHMREEIVMRCVFQGLVKFEEGAWNVVPELATHWHEAEDGLSIVFYLRQGVAFHQNYGEFTAEDVKFSFEHIAASDSSISGHSAWSVLKEVVVLSRYVVKLVLKNPCPHLFSSILAQSAGLIASKKAVEMISRSQFAFNPVGTGPYEIKAFKPRERIELESFDQFWGEAPKTKRLIFRLDTQAFNVRQKFNSGGLDVALLSNLNPENLKGAPNLVQKRLPGFYQYWWLGLIVTKPPFDQLAVRQAVRLALDRDNIRAAGLFNTAPLNAPIPEGLEGHWPDAPRFEYFPEKARELIAAAGVKADQPLILAADPSEIDLAALEIIKGNLSDIGLNVQLDLTNRFVLLEKINRGECHLYLDFFVAFVDAYLSLSWFVKGQFFNLSHWNNPAYARLVTAIGREADPDRRREMIIAAQKIIVDDCWAVWLAQGGYSIIHKSYIDPGTPLPDGFLTPWTIQKN